MAKKAKAKKAKATMPTHDAETSDLVHVRLPIKAEGEQRTECVWAEPLGGNRFRIKNIPFFHDQARFMDVVEAGLDSEDSNAYRFVRVVEPKGNGVILFSYRDRETFRRCSALAQRHARDGVSLEGGRGPSDDSSGIAAMSVPRKAWSAIERWFDREIERGAVSVETYDEPTASNA